MAPLYGEGLPICCLDTPEHVSSDLSVGDNCLVPCPGLVHEAMRLNVVGEGETDSENSEVSMTQHVWINAHSFADKKGVFIAAFLRPPLLDWDSCHQVLI